MRGGESGGRNPGAAVEPATEPTFSIMCSAYQCEAYIADTIESVLGQDYADWELIVVDNGMSDTVAAIVERYTHDPRVQLIRQENRRLVGGIAAAAAASRGRFLVPLDSDDQLTPEFCGRMAAVFDANPHIDVLSCDSSLFVDDHDLDLARSFLRRTTGLGHPLTLADLIGNSDVVPYFAAFRRDAWFGCGGYAAGDDLVEDIALFLRLVGTGHDVRVLPERLTRYRVRSDSSSHDPSSIEAFERNRESAYTNAARESGDPETLRVLDQRLRWLRYEQALRRARWTFMQNDLAAARAAAREAFRQRRTARSAAVLVGLSVAPSVLRRIHPVKRQVHMWVSRVAAQVAAWRSRTSIRP